MYAENVFINKHKCTLREFSNESCLGCKIFIFSSFLISLRFSNYCSPNAELLIFANFTMLLIIHRLRYCSYTGICHLPILTVYLLFLI